MTAERSHLNEPNDHLTPISASQHIGPAAIGLDEDIRMASVENLNQLLVDTLALRDLYKKHHWQASGSTFHQMHLLFDKHADEQGALADAVAERVQTLGGVSLAAPHDVAENTHIDRPPKDRESTRDQLRRLLQAHEIVLMQARDMARAAAAARDDGTNDLIVSQAIRTNKTHSWFIGEHLSNATAAQGNITR